MSAAELKRQLPPFNEKYDVERVLGRGGMGTVFEARHSRLGHRVAIKVLGEELRRHPDLVRRFEREARAASALTSPHAVRVFDIDTTDDGTPFIVMELLAGRDLAQLVEKEGAQAIGMSVRWIIEACDAIAEAHRLGIIHRDIKPSNLLLCDSGIIKVLDFGIAKRIPGAGAKSGEREAAITMGVAPLGTPQYMSPEQVRCAKDVDARSDIWSLAVTLYELITGRPPFNHDVPQACVAAIVADPVPDPREFRADISEELAAVIMRALSKNAADRYANVDELVEALRPFADMSTTHAPSWRVISGLRPVSPALAGTKDSTTLDGDELIVPLLTPSVPQLDPLPKLRDAAEETVPPAITRATHTEYGRKIRSSFAFGAAAVLGLVALVVTPRFVGGSVDAPTSASARTVVETTAIAPAMATPSSEATGEGSSEEPTAKAAEIPVAVDPTPAPLASARPSGSASAGVVKVKPKASTGPVRIIGNERPVHGGISNPGF